MVPQPYGSTTGSMGSDDGQYTAWAQMTGSPYQPSSRNLKHFLKKKNSLIQKAFSLKNPELILHFSIIFKLSSFYMYIKLVI